MAVSTPILAHHAGRLNSFGIECRACSEPLLRSSTGEYCPVCRLELTLRARRREHALARLWFAVGALPTWRAAR
jgi:predicted amidophosphoribosyltransferase